MADGCFYCGSASHAMAVEIGPDGLCWENIRSRHAAQRFASRVSAYWRWIYGQLSFSALLAS